MNFLRGFDLANTKKLFLVSLIPHQKVKIYLILRGLVLRYLGKIRKIILTQIFSSTIFSLYD